MATDFPGTGVPHNNSHDVDLPGWVSEDLLAHTRRVFGMAYSREIDQSEAVEILTNVRHLVESLWQAMN